jgi:hypothetical protein
MSRIAHDAGINISLLRFNALIGAIKTARFACGFDHLGIVRVILGMKNAPNCLSHQRSSREMNSKLKTSPNIPPYLCNTPWELEQSEKKRQ